jgi:hypothetical protein
MSRDPNGSWGLLWNGTGGGFPSAAVNQVTYRMMM